LEHVRDEVKPDIIIWTGDNSAHNVWDNTLEEAVGSVVNVTKAFKDILGNTDITIVPIHGNHDFWPPNLHDFDEVPGDCNFLREYA
jgi:Calcineurin-like phosphoesterase